MKKQLVSTLISIFLSLGSVASGQTNRIDLNLNFLSSRTNYTAYTTNNFVTVSGFRTNRVYTTNEEITTNLVFKAAQKPVTSQNVIDAISSNAPSLSHLALITDPSGSNYVVIQAEGTNFMTVTNFNFTVINSVFAGTEKISGSTDVTVPNSEIPLETALITASLSTPTLSFNVTVYYQSPGNQGALFGGSSDGGVGYVVGSGADSLGTNEIVTGTVVLR